MTEKNVEWQNSMADKEMLVILPNFMAFWAKLKINRNQTFYSFSLKSENMCFFRE